MKKTPVKIPPKAQKVEVYVNHRVPIISIIGLIVLMVGMFLVYLAFGEYLAHPPPPPINVYPPSEMSNPPPEPQQDSNVSPIEPIAPQSEPTRQSSQKPIEHQVHRSYNDNSFEAHTSPRGQPFVARYLR